MNKHGMLAYNYKRECKKVYHCSDCCIGLKQCSNDLGGLIPSLHSVDHIIKRLKGIETLGGTK